MQRVKINIKGLAGQDSAQRLESALKVDAGVANVKVNHENGMAVVVFDEDVTSQFDVLNLIKNNGYTPAVTADGVDEFVSGSSGRGGSWLEKFTPKQVFAASIAIPVLLAVVIGGIVIAGNDTGSSGSKKSGGGILQKITGNLGGGSGAHILGPKDAPVKLVEYSDFECPFCGRHFPTIKKILAEYGDQVSFEYKHYPLSFHPLATPAANASECAAEQDEFWTMHDTIFENQSLLSLAQLNTWAEQIGLNMDKFEECMTENRYNDLIQEQFAEGNSVGVNGTPATFVNGKLISGAVPYETFKTEIDAILADS